MKISIVIPAYNESGTISELLNLVKQTPMPLFEKEIIVVNDASTDGTKDILEKYQKDNEDVIVLHHEKNKGKGAALRTGFARATGEFVVVQDADLEYDPADIYRMAAYAVEHCAPIVYGSRRLKKQVRQYSAWRYFAGGALVTWVTNLLFGVRITDEPTCYKLFRRSVLMDFPLRCERFEFCPEVTACAVLRRIPIAEIPISYAPRGTSEGKKIRWYDGVEAIAVLLRYRLFGESLSFWRLFHFSLLSVFVIGAIHLVFYDSIFGFRENNDTNSFIDAITFFQQTGDVIDPNRYLNPLYGIFGAFIFPFLSAVSVLKIVNYLSYIVILLSGYGLFRRVFQSREAGFFGAMTLLTSYATIRYGLTQVQDIGAFAFLALTLYAGWRWYESREYPWLFLGSAAVAFGMLVKESGAMGALFFGMLFLWSYRHHIAKAVGHVALFSILPALTILVNGIRGADFTFSSADWFVLNWERYAAYNYTLVKWLGINATTFNIVWVFALVGLFAFVRRFREIPENIKVFIFAVLPVSASYLAWPLFMSRTVYIASWLMAGLAILGIAFLTRNYILKKVFWISIGLIVLVPYVLQITIGYTPLFLILEECKYRPMCSLETFIRVRGEFDGFRLHSDKLLE